jgi:hypothetical protein
VTSPIAPAEEQNPQEPERPALPSELWGHETNWPIEGHVAQILAIDTSPPRRERLRAGLAFNEAPAQLNEIRDALRDLALEDWRTLDPQLQADTEGQVNMVIAVLNGMLQATSADPNIHGP